MREYVLVLLVTAAVTYLLTPLVRRFAVATRAMHAPRARDVHTKPTPLLGGLAMYGGLIAGLIVASRLTALQDPFRQAGSRTEIGLVLAGALVVVIGFVDDRWGLGPISKLAGQVAAAGLLVWSGESLPWLPLPSGGVFSLEQDLSVTLTILVVVITMNGINFIDGMDGLAAGIVAVAATGYLVYTYHLVSTLHIQSQSLPATSSALVAGMCLGFLPHNFHPARIFMGDIGAMLLGLMLAYGPISSTSSLDPALLVNNPQVNRFPTILPLLVLAAIFIIPYTDLMLAVIRRTKRGKSPMSADKEHLHHRLMNIGHSYRQSVLIMYLWAALFSVAVLALSLVRTPLFLLVVATVVAVLTLLPLTIPRLRPWRWATPRPRAPRPRAPRPSAPRPAPPAPAQPAPHPVPSAVFRPAPPGPGPMPAQDRLNGTATGSGAWPGNASDSWPRHTEAGLRPFPGDGEWHPLGTGPQPTPDTFRTDGQLPSNGHSQSPAADPYPRPGRLSRDDRLTDTDPFPAAP
jgi:UDP-GlcNAc:undecaprenyl-phosphate/decaprenyl-phosphate GlcNAc-1-phosphate transferase